MVIRGLSSADAKERLKRYGKNTIRMKNKASVVKIFVDQFRSPIMWLLIAACIVSFYMGEYTDGYLIGAIALISAVAGFVQEYKAEKAVEALRKMLVRKAKVIRDGRETIVPAEEIVPDDIIITSGGDVVPADCTVIEGEIDVDESPITGESGAVTKKKGDRVFMGCSVYRGRALLKVTATGMDTEIGKIASKMEEMRDEKTPFQRHMEGFTKKLAAATTIIVLVVILAGFQKFGLFESFMVGVALAVAAIPEDLPAIVTVTLSLGARNMAKKMALVRRLAVTESIGSITVICTDKTGTLTEGRMKVVELWGKNEKLARMCCFFCNDAREVDGKIIGDETDVALLEWAGRFDGRRIDNIPFSSDRKMMSVLCEVKGKYFVFSKGAPEVIVDKCSLKEDERNEILKKNEYFASNGYRVLALAYKKSRSISEDDLKFIGLIVLSDPPRKEAKEAVTDCLKAGIRVIMITGDNPLTAKVVAEKVGISSPYVITGYELDGMEDKELEEVVRKCNIFARTSPFHKLRILEALKRMGENVAMTGDGVNDALALKKADVGIAMGVKGTEVAKEASDIILLDDNFATIRNAVEEGRRIFNNIRKFVNYLLSCNLAEVLVILFGTVYFPFTILYPIQILWINLITDGLPAIAFSTDPPSERTMREKPRKQAEGIINREISERILVNGCIMAVILTLTFLSVTNEGIDTARTVLITGFIMFEFERVFTIRYNDREPIFLNKLLILSLICSFILHLAVLYTPLSASLNLVPLKIEHWIILIAGATVGGILSIAINRLLKSSAKKRYMGDRLLQ